jgi:hypothetical protein
MRIYEEIWERHEDFVMDHKIFLVQLYILIDWYIGIVWGFSPGW